MTQHECVQLDDVLQVYHVGYHGGHRSSSIREPPVESATSITVQYRVRGAARMSGGGRQAPKRRGLNGKGGRLHTAAGCGRCGRLQRPRGGRHHGDHNFFAGLFPDVSTRVCPCAAGGAAADSGPGSLSAQAGPTGRLTVGPVAVTATGGTDAARTAAVPRACLFVASGRCHRASCCHGGRHSGGHGSHPPAHGAMATGRRPPGMRLVCWPSGARPRRPGGCRIVARTDEMAW